MHHYVYVLKSQKDGNLYIGCTKDLEKRLMYHNNGKVVSTKHRRPLDLVYKEEYDSIYRAFRAERFYKTAKGKKAIIEKIKHWEIV